VHLRALAAVADVALELEARDDAVAEVCPALALAAVADVTLALAARDDAVACPALVPWRGATRSETNASRHQSAHFLSRVTTVPPDLYVHLRVVRQVLRLMRERRSSITRNSFRGCDHPPRLHVTMNHAFWLHVPT
jgi:hypothetical protein